ncbi:MAG: hypothetical protein KGN84_02695 [Acidobacteriota bacterium]|nr:hypothetical protein [Acidobacteriota bacterium]
MIKTGFTAGAVAAACLLSFSFPIGADPGEEGPGAVYTMTNDPLANAILAYARDGAGTLTAQGMFFTGGRGTGGTKRAIRPASLRTVSVRKRAR